jgi:hypothetical protein
VDVFVTSVHAAGGTLPGDRSYDGVNLLPHVKGLLQEPPHEVLVWRSIYNHAIRNERWKLILNDREGHLELYDLQTDKVESKNRTADQHERVEHLLEQLERIERGFMPPLWPRVMDYHFTIDGVEYVFAI